MQAAETRDKAAVSLNEAQLLLTRARARSSPPPFHANARVDAGSIRAFSKEGVALPGKTEKGEEEPSGGRRVVIAGKEGRYGAHDQARDVEAAEAAAAGAGGGGGEGSGERAGRRGGPGSGEEEGWAGGGRAATGGGGKEKGEGRGGGRQQRRQEEEEEEGGGSTDGRGARAS